MSIFKENIPNSSESWNMKHYVLFIPTPQCTSQDLYNEFLCIFPEFIYAWTSMCVCVYYFNTLPNRHGTQESACLENHLRQFVPPLHVMILIWGPDHWVKGCFSRGSRKRHNKKGTKNWNRHLPTTTNCHWLGTSYMPRTFLGTFMPVTSLCPHNAVINGAVELKEEVLVSGGTKRWTRDFKAYIPFLLCIASFPASTAWSRRWVSAPLCVSWPWLRSCWWWQNCWCLIQGPAKWQMGQEWLSHRGIWW